MASRLKLGLITPSSNTIMEPRTYELLQGVEGVSAHFARLQVVQISLDPGALNQFSYDAQLAAAAQLAEARCDVITWGGTSGGWVGFDHDRELARRITEATGVPASTSTLAQLAAFQRLGVRRYGLVTPYLSDVQAAILTNYAAAGYDCAAERHLEDKGNYSFSEYDEATIARLTREVAADRPDAIAIYCTNFNGTRIAPGLERELGIPVIDSVAVTVWHALVLAGGDPSRIAGQGRLFAPETARPAPAGAE